MIDGVMYLRHDNIQDLTLRIFIDQYDDQTITKDDIFCYVYAVLQSPAYLKRYRNNLQSAIPNVPLAPDFWAFRDAGNRLIKLHLGADDCPEYPLTVTVAHEDARRKEAVQVPTARMKYVNHDGKTVSDSSPGCERHSVKVNEFITVGGIPALAHEFELDGESAINLVLKGCFEKPDEVSGIVHDPNDWFDEVGDDIVSKLKRITWMSIETAKIIATLPTPFTDGWEPEGEVSDADNTQSS